MATGTTWTGPGLDGVEHHYVTLEGTRLHYAEAGAGDAVVLLHGWPQHWWSWREIIGPLASSYRVICPDLRGLGWSDAPAAPYTFRVLVGDLIALLDTLQIPSARLVGHDWGLAVGYQACFDHPERLTHFVALAGVTPWSAPDISRRLAWRIWHTYVNAVAGTTATSRLGLPESRLGAWRHVGEFDQSDLNTYLAQLRRPGSASATQAWYRNLICREIPRYAIGGRYTHLRVPTLHLNGADDPLTKGIRPGSYSEHADNFRLEVIANCGHFIPEERPKVLVGRLLEHLREIQDQRRAERNSHVNQ